MNMINLLIITLIIVATTLIPIVVTCLGQFIALSDFNCGYYSGVINMAAPVFILSFFDKYLK